MNKPIRVLQIGMHDKIGGVETFLMNYYCNINHEMIQFDFINPYDTLCFEKEIKELGGRIYKLPNFKKHPLKYCTSLKKIIKENKYDIVHINLLSTANILPIIVASECRVKHIISHSHNNGIPEGFLRKILHFINKKVVIKRSTDFFACSESAGKWMFGKQEFKVIENAVDLSRFSYNEKLRDEIRKKYNIEDKIVIGHVGRFEEQKNHDFLIDVFYELCKKNGNYVLMLIGEGILETSIKEKVYNLGLNEKVLFLGKQDFPEHFYSTMDLFLLPSKFEGLGIVNVEAQASGLPCIVSDEVPEEVNLSPIFYRLPLEKEEWVKKILSVDLKYNRNWLDERLNLYNIFIASKKLQNIYMNCKKKKIIHYVYGLVDGGVEKVLYSYFSKLDKTLYELYIICQQDSNTACKQKFEDLGFRVFQVCPKKQILKNFNEVKQILKDIKPDIIHCHMTESNFYPLFIAKMCGVKTRISHSHIYNPKKNLKTRFFLFLGKIFANKYVSCSKEAAVYAFGKKKLKTNKVIILHNAFDLEKFHFSQKTRNDYRKKLDIEEDYTILNIGRFAYQKNHVFLIRLFSEYLKIHPKSKLLLVGNGELQSQIKELVNKLKIEKKVIFLNNRDDIPSLIMASDLFLFPTLFEGLGIVLLEAQLLNLPCVTSDVIPEEAIITSNVACLSLAENIEKWLDVMHSVKKKEMTFEKLKQIYSEAGYNIELEYKKLQKIYE